MIGWSVTLNIFSNKDGEMYMWDVEKLGLKNLAEIQFWTGSVRYLES